MTSINKKTLSEQIYQILREDILNQKIKSGEKLTLHTLRDRFQVSQTPVREALTRLVDDYLVGYSSNVGVTVVTFTPKIIKEIYEFSAELDCAALRFSFLNNEEAFIKRLKDICEQAERCLESKNLDEWKTYSDLFHLAFFEYADNTWLERAAKKMRAQLTLLSNLYQYNSNIQKIHQDHLEIFNLLKQGELIAAEDSLRAHYQRDLGYAIEATKGSG